MRLASGALATLTLAAVGSSPSHARADERGRLQVMAGVGLMSPEGDARGNGTGGYGQVEYVPAALEWLRVYGGGMWANTDEDSCGVVDRCELTARLGFAGAKIRMKADIPLVQPFFELGVGASAGKTRVRSGLAVDSRASGVMAHVPLALGLRLGRTYAVEVGIQMMFVPAADALVGAFAAGVEFPL